jgi:hypothetical protein
MAVWPIQDHAHVSPHALHHINKGETMITTLAALALGGLLVKVLYLVLVLAIIWLILYCIETFISPIPQPIKLVIALVVLIIVIIEILGSGGI